ncbi:glycoside hydrolase family 75 protein [Streptomyces sp. NPDC058045]|uniref:glycoside hydrolase family 75 protein n=1 Tax=Streptomyces sp. NPDC058045 TaxID=3346311 RepID=UPI0036E07D69
MHIRPAARGALIGAALLPVAALAAAALPPLPWTDPDRPAPRTAPPAAGPEHPAPVTAAQLLDAVRDCEQISDGRYRTDEEKEPTIPVCATGDRSGGGTGRGAGVVHWTADMDIDCDGRPGRYCNARTDPYFADLTNFTASDGGPLDAERLPYVVVPEPSDRWDHREYGIGAGTAAAIVYRGMVRYAVVGDTGPADLIGEASHAAAASLGIPPHPGGGGAPDHVTYIFFPHSKVSPVESIGAAQAEGERRARQLLGRQG